jgi:hypothetical protein
MHRTGINAVTPTSRSKLPVIGRSAHRGITVVWSISAVEVPDALTTRRNGLVARFTDA